MAAQGGLMGGRNLGTAWGAFRIDTSTLQGVTATARRVGQEVNKAMGGIAQGVQRAESAFVRLSKGIGRLRGELTALSVASGLLTGLGLRTAGSFEEAEIQLSGMVGGLGQARVLIEDLRKRAAAAGVPFADMLAVATRLLPTMQGNTEELEKWYDLTRRVAVLNQREGLAGAAFSINEALTSGGTDLVSLTERFNISRVQLRQALEQTGGDFAAALDQVLTRMGITTQTADEMGRTFNASLRVARDAAVQLLAEGFTPLLNTLTPLLQRGAEWLRQLRETNPAAVQAGAGLTALVAAGAPALLLFNQLAEAAAKLRGLRFLGAAGVGAGIGALAGFGLVRGIGAVTGDEFLQNFGWEQFVEGFKRGLLGILTQFSDTAGQFTTGLASAAAEFISAIAQMTLAMGNFVIAVGRMVPAALGGNRLLGAGGEIMERGGALGNTALMIQEGARRANQQRQRELAELTRMLFPPSVETGGGAAAQARAQQEAINAELLKAQVNYYQSVQRIEQQAAEQRLDATRQYEQQRTSTIRQYELTLARDAEDFARQRARAVTQFGRQVAQVQEEAARREAEWQADLDERIAEVRADGNERLAEIEEDYQRQRERSAEQHRETLLGAAARLDARAVLEEQRRYAREQRDAGEAHQDRISDEQESLAERIAQEQEAHQERLQEARDADARRLVEMQEAFDEQQRIEDEDREIRLARMAQDHNDQLVEMDRAHQERLTQIDRHAAQERVELDQAFAAQLADLKLHNVAWIQEQKRLQDASTELFQQMWGDWRKTMEEAYRATQPLFDVPTRDQTRWQAPSLLSPDTWPSMQGGIPAQASAASRTTSVTVEAGAIVVNEATRPGQTAVEVEEALVKILGELQ